jgi:hypothetical protein
MQSPKSLDLRIGDRAFFPGRARHGRIVVRLSLPHIGTRACSVVLGLVKRLLGLKTLACQRAGSCELGLHIFQASVCLGDLNLQRVYLLAANAGIDVITVCG